MAKKKSDNKPDKQQVLRTVLAALALIGLVAVGTLGYRWLMTVPYERLDLVGIQHADSSALLGLAKVDTGQVLFDIDPELVSDRVRRHPWVEEARTTRFLPTSPTRTASCHRLGAVL